MNRYKLVLSALMLLLLGACSKPDETPTPEEDLRNGTWGRPGSGEFITPGKMTYKDPVTNGDSTREYLPGGKDCHLDNTLQFKTNGIGLLSYGVERCTGSEAENKTFNWEMSQDGREINMYGVADFFGTDNVKATVLVRSMGYLSIKYSSITVDPRFQTADTVVYTDVIRRK